MLELFIRLPFLPEIWTRAEAKLGAEVSAYWKRVPVNPFGIEPDLLLGMAQKLVEHGQPAAAVDCLYVLAHEKRIIPADLTYAALQGGLSVEGQQKRIDQHHIDERARQKSTDRIDRALQPSTKILYWQRLAWKPASSSLRGFTTKAPRNFE
jgi:hypothetical protein